MNLNTEKLSPIVIFAYNRLDLIENTIEALKKCDLAADSDLIIYSDGVKNENDISKINAVRSFISTISGFKKISWNFSTKNKGLAKSIIEGVTEVLSHYNSVIVLEDDLAPTKNFLQYTNQALIQYENIPEVMSIAGYTPTIKPPSNYNYDNYFTQRASSWGWATWKNKWENIDWEISDYESFISNKKERKKFNQMGSDMVSLLKKQQKGTINSWAIRWCYHQFKNNLYTVTPVSSKVKNIGFTDEATHTKGAKNRFKTNIDKGNKTKFKFLLTPVLDPIFIKQFTAINSIKERTLNKINVTLKTLINKI